MRRVLRALCFRLLWLLSLLVSGCHQDLLKATPFARGIDEETTEDRVALWPLFYHRGTATSFLWPVGEITDDSWAIRPLIAVYGKRKRMDILWPFIHVDPEDRSGYFAPLFGWKPDPDGFVWTPLVGWGGREDSSGWFYSPLYTSTWGSDERWQVIPPLLTAWGHDSDASWFGSPPYVESRHEEGVDRALPILLSWWSLSKKGDWSANVLLSLFGIARSSERSSEHLFPLYWRGWSEKEGRSGRSEWFALVPFYAGVRSRDGFRFDSLPFLLSARTETPSGNPGWHFLLSLVAWGSRPTRGGAPDGTFHRVLPLYWYDREPRRVQFGLLPPLYSHTLRENGDWSVDYLLFLGRISSSTSRESSRFFPLYSWSSRQIEVDDAPDSKETSESTHLIEKTRFELLLYLYDHLRERYADGDEYRRHRVLWRLYHDEGRRGRRSIDIFPFIAYDRSGEESLTWSWLYKFIRYERRGVEKALYLFFLPAIRW